MVLLCGVAGEATGASPGLLWGRLAVEEESPDGPWTPLVGVEVILYPFAPDVLADLEQIRRSARDSGAHFEAAVARVQERLRTYAAELDAGGDAEGDPVRRQVVTDVAGLFVFEGLPAGEWLLVAQYVTPYPAAAGDRARGSTRRSEFLPRSRAGPAQKAELWVARVSMPRGTGVRLMLTDRARWLVGPLR